MKNNRNRLRHTKIKKYQNNWNNDPFRRPNQVISSKKPVIIFLVVESIIWLFIHVRIRFELNKMIVEWIWL